MIKIGYSSSTGNRIYRNLLCGCCGNFLGYCNTEDGQQYDSTYGWEFCPYCGRELYEDD